MIEQSAVAVCRLEHDGETMRLCLLHASPLWHSLLQGVALTPEHDLLSLLSQGERTRVIELLEVPIAYASQGLETLLTLGGTVWKLQILRAEHVVLFLSSSPAHASQEREQHRLPLDLAPIAQRVLDLLPLPVFVKDRQHRWILFNESFCELLKLPGDQLLGRSDYDFIPREQADIFWQKDEELFSSMRAVINEEAITSADGVQRWILTHKIPMTLPNGEQGLLGVITDITRRKLAEEQLLRNVEARDHAISSSLNKSRFLASMSHELRTPLNAIMGYAEILHEELEELEPAMARRDLERVTHAARHLLFLIDDVLALSESDTQSLQIHPERFALKPLIEELSAAIVPSLNAEQQTLILHLSEEPSHVTLDRRRLKQILMNLLSNAVKFAPRGVIALHTSQHDEDLLIEVSDEGPGIPTTHLNAIFRPFERLQHNASLIQGTGLGLGLARHMAQLMGGDIAAHSPGTGGALFRVRLPIHLSLIDTPAPDSSATSAHLSSLERMQQRLSQIASPDPRPTILIIDDDEATYELLERFSKELELNLLWTPHPSRSVSLARECQPALIVLDLVMPMRDGWSVLEELRQHQDLAALPVLMLTFGDPSPERIQREGIALLRKPITKSQWTHYIKHHLKMSPTP